MPVPKAPHFPQQPVARQNEDGSLELECYFEASPQPEIKWVFQEKELKDGGRLHVRCESKENDNYSAVLQIKDLTDGDAGSYKCQITNPSGKGNANFNLKLTGFSAPTFIDKPKISSKQDGQVMVMEFRAKSVTKPTVVWQKDGEIVADSDRLKILYKDEGKMAYLCQLEIKDPTKEKDAGQFVCIMKNDSGKLTASFTVKFEVPQGAPTFVGKPQILQKSADGGEPLILMEVRFKADTAPTVTWLNPKGKKMKESSRIKFVLTPEGDKAFLAQFELKNYKSKDSGTYICNIRNEAGEANCELTINIEGYDEE